MRQHPPVVTRQCSVDRAFAPTGNFALQMASAFDCTSVSVCSLLSPARAGTAPDAAHHLSVDRRCTEAPSADTRQSGNWLTLALDGTHCGCGNTLRDQARGGCGPGAVPGFFSTASGKFREIRPAVVRIAVRLRRCRCRVDEIESHRQCRTVGNCIRMRQTEVGLRIVRQVLAIGDSGATIGRCRSGRQYEVCAQA